MPIYKFKQRLPLPAPCGFKWESRAQHKYINSKRETTSPVPVPTGTPCNRFSQSLIFTNDAEQWLLLASMRIYEAPAAISHGAATTNCQNDCIEISLGGIVTAHYGWMILSLYLRLYLNLRILTPVRHHLDICTMHMRTSLLRQPEVAITSPRQK
jgi:hypothetical protein